jgi:anti-anti-sigma factor
LTTRIEVPAPTRTRQLLSLKTEWLNPWLVRITAAGQIDAANADDLAEYVFRHAANSRELILELREVSFFAVESFARLQTIDARCRQASVALEIVPSQAVSRVIELCDPTGEFRSSAA